MEDKGSKQAKTVVGQLVFELGVDMNSLNSSLRKATKSADVQLTSSFKGIGKKIAGALGTAAIVSFTKSCIDLGSSVSEVQNVVDTTFTSMSAQVNDFAKNAMTTYGLSELKAKEYVSTLGAMSQSMGTTEAKAYEMSTAVAGLAGDVASFYNLDTDEAYNKLKGIWTGETEALKSLGIVMTQTALDEYALNEGFGKTSAKMTEQEKLLLRYQYVTSSLGKATGDFVKTQDSWANQTRILSLRFDSLKASLGKGFINILTPLLKIVNQLVERLAVLAQGFADFTATLFGVSEASDGLSQITNSATDTAGGIDNITNSTKEALKELAGFDKITKLGDSTQSSGTSSDVSEMIPGGTVSNQVGVVLGAAESLKEILGPLTESFEDFKAAVEPFGKHIGEGLVWLYENALKPLATWTITDLVPSFLDMLSGAIELLDGIIEAFKPTGKWLWDNFLKPLATWTGSLIVDLFNDLGDALSSMSKNKDLCTFLASLLTTFTAFEVGKAGYKGITNLYDKVKNLGAIGKVSLAITAAFVAADVGFNLGNKLYELLSGEKVEMSASMQIKYLSDATWDEIGHAFKKMVDDCIEYIKSLFGMDSNSSSSHTNTSGSGRTHSGDGRSFGRSHSGGGRSLDKNELIGNSGEAEEKGKKIGRAMAKGVTSGYTCSIGTSLGTVSDATNTLVNKGIKEKISKLPSFMQSTTRSSLNTISRETSSNTSIWTSFKSLVDSSVKKPFSDVGGYYNNVFSDAWRKISNSASSNTSISSAFKSLVDNSVKKPFKGIGDHYGNLFSDAWRKIKNSASSASGDFGKINDSFSSSYKNITNKLISGINTSIAGPFKTINNTLNKVRNISVFGLKPFSKLWNNNPIGLGKLIPFLAEGAYVKPNTPQLAMIGDNRHQGEVVAPEDKLKEMALEAVRAAGNGYNREILATLKLILQILQGFDLNIVIDGKKLKDIIVDKINEQTRATGVCEITL